VSAYKLCFLSTWVQMRPHGLQTSPTTNSTQQFVCDFEQYGVSIWPRKHACVCDFEQYVVSIWPRKYACVCDFDRFDVQNQLIALWLLSYLEVWITCLEYFMSSRSLHPCCQTLSIIVISFLGHLNNPSLVKKLQNCHSSLEPSSWSGSNESASNLEGDWYSRASRSLSKNPKLCSTVAGIRPACWNFWKSFEVMYSMISRSNSVFLDLVTLTCLLLLT
jgi:hypothetical protein